MCVCVCVLTASQIYNRCPVKNVLCVIITGAGVISVKPVGGLKSL